MNLDAQDHSSQALKSLSAQLGCQFSNIEEKEAARLWDTLNHLADDPIAYDNFMAKQLQHLDSNKDGEVLLNQKTASSAVPPFVPLQGFVVKTFTHPDGTKLFVNICHHGTAVKKPFDENGIVVADSCQQLENIQIPLLISKQRNCFDGNNNKAMAVDVVVNSWCIHTCKKKTSFRTELVALAINSLKEEHSVKLETRGQIPWKIIKSKYKGGLGNYATNPRPFEDSQEPKSIKTKTVTESPLDLLKCREKQNEESQSKQGVLKIPQMDKAKKESTKLIQEISGHQPAVASASVTKNAPSKSSPSNKKGPVIKPGFLNQCSTKKPLYSKGGSTNDGSSGTGGLMSKCKVVDTAKHIGNDPGKAALDPEFQVAQTLKDLSMMMCEEPKNGSKASGNELAPSDEEVNAVGKDNVECGLSNGSSENTIAGKSNNDVTMTTSDRQTILQVDLSFCQPKIESMNDLDLRLTTTSFLLAAPQSNKRWSAQFPHPVDVGSVSAKFRRKQHMLEVVCLRKKPTLDEMVW